MTPITNCHCQILSQLPESVFSYFPVSLLLSHFPCPLFVFSLLVIRQTKNSFLLSFVFCHRDPPGRLGDQKRVQLSVSHRRRCWSGACDGQQQHRERRWQQWLPVGDGRPQRNPPKRRRRSRIHGDQRSFSFTENEQNKFLRLVRHLG